LVSPGTGTKEVKLRCRTAQWGNKESDMKKIILASALVVGMVAAASAQGQTPVPTPSNPGGSIQQQEMNRNNGSSSMVAPGKTTGSGAAIAQDPTNTKAGDPQKKSMDDPKEYGKPDKH
jgi:hypothetical protein